MIIITNMVIIMEIIDDELEKITLLDVESNT